MTTMTRYDLSEFRAFAADLKHRMDDCDNGEGMECSSLDGSLLHYAEWCDEFREHVCEWGMGIFAGRVSFDPEVERILREEGHQLFGRASEWLSSGKEGEGECFTLEAITVLEPAVMKLGQLLRGWITPQLSVSPSARNADSLTPEMIAEAQAKVSSLPPLPENWQPTDERQRQRYKKLRRLRKPRSAEPGTA